MRMKISILVVSVLLFSVSSPITVSAASPKYKTCEIVRKKYPRGVAVSRTKAKKTRATISASVYKANRKLDTDNDGIVCERGQRAINPATTIPKTIGNTFLVPNTPAPTSQSTTPASSAPLATSAPLTTLAPATTTLAPATTTTTTTIPGSFGSGTKSVGSGGITAGRYLTTSASSCYWERLSGFGGTLDEIISNDATSGSHIIVDIKSSDVGFSSSRCGTWRPYVAAPPSVLTDGVWSIGDEMAPGTWSATFTGTCYWERVRGFGGTLDEIIANEIETSSAIVQISSSDVGFATSRCGTWTKIG
jgi:hypothetical protein